MSALRWAGHLLGSVPPGDPLGPVQQDPDQVRDAACRLVEPDRVCHPPDPPDLHPPAGLGLIGTVLQWLVWVVFIALVVVLLVLLVRAAMGMSGRGSGRRRRRRRLDEPDVELLGTVQIDTSREPSDWRREADEHRRAGRAREAIRCRYRALVGDLARLDLIDEIPGRTTGEERAQLVVVAPIASAPFDAVAELFDDTWYGLRHATDADVADIERLEDQVLQRVPGRAARQVVDA